MRRYAKTGEWNIECMVCGKVIKASESIERWDGLRVCQEDTEQRHPLDMVPPFFQDEEALPFTSPRSADTSILVTYATATTPVPPGNFDTNNGTI
jgi:hypothetical protein